MSDLIPLLPHINASLNALAALLLVTGYVLIKQRRESAHRRTMLTCFSVSVLFLASYLTYHANTAAVHRFPSYPPAAIRYAYYFVLLTHVLLAAVIPVLALATLALGLRDRRVTHVRLARWTLPIWLYVSVTGVLVYLMLYHWFPPPRP